MDKFMYFIHQHRKGAFIVAAAFVILIVASVILVIHNRSGGTSPDDSGQLADGTINGNGTAIFDDDGNLINSGDVREGGVNGLAEQMNENVRVILSLDEGSVEHYEVGMDLATGNLKIYLNGQDTGKKSTMTDYTLTDGLLIIDEDAELKLTADLQATKVEGTYKGSAADASGLLKMFKNDGYSVGRLVRTSNYIDCYLIKEGASIKRMIYTEGNIFIADYTETELPNLDEYLCIEL